MRVEPPFFKEREVWWTSVGANVGHEQGGKNSNFERPVLVLRKFNKHIFWGIPQSSRGKVGKYYYQTEDGGKSYSLILSQLRVFSSRRLLRKLRTISSPEFTEIKDKIRNLI